MGPFKNHIWIILSDTIVVQFAEIYFDKYFLAKLYQNCARHNGQTKRQTLIIDHYNYLILNSSIKFDMNRLFTQHIINRKLGIKPVKSINIMNMTAM